MTVGDEQATWIDEEQGTWIDLGYILCSERLLYNCADNRYDIIIQVLKNITFITNTNLCRGSTRGCLGFGGLLGGLGSWTATTVGLGFFKADLIKRMRGKQEGGGGGGKKKKKKKKKR